MDEDLETMSREQLAAEVRRLRAGVRAHRDSTGHALCWHHPALWGLLPERTDLPTVPVTRAMRRIGLRTPCSRNTNASSARTSAKPSISDSALAAGPRYGSRDGSRDS